MQPASKALLSGNNLATHHDHHMKHIITKLIAVAVALAATGVAVPEAKAAASIASAAATTITVRKSGWIT